MVQERLRAARPYARAVIKDQKARKHALAALGDARALQRQFQGDKPPEAIARLIDDESVHSHLRSLSKELNSVSQRATRRRRPGRWIALLAGGSFVLLVNPVTGPRLRGRLASLVDRSGETLNGDGNAELEVGDARANGDRERLNEMAENTGA